MIPAAMIVCAMSLPPAFFSHPEEPQDRLTVAGTVVMLYQSYRRQVYGEHPKEGRVVLFGGPDRLLLDFYRVGLKAYRLTMGLDRDRKTPFDVTGNYMIPPFRFQSARFLMWVVRPWPTQENFERSVMASLPIVEPGGFGCYPTIILTDSILTYFGWEPIFEIEGYLIWRKPGARMDGPNGNSPTFYIRPSEKRRAIELLRGESA